MLTPCKECKEPVSHNAKTCPKCGAPDPSITLGSMIGGVVVLAGLIVAVPIGCNMLAGNDDAPPVQQAAAVPAAALLPDPIPDLGLWHGDLVLEMEDYFVELAPDFDFEVSPLNDGTWRKLWTSELLLVELTGQPGISEERPLTKVTAMLGGEKNNVSHAMDATILAGMLMKALIPEWDNSLDEFRDWLDAGTPPDVRYRYGRYVEFENMAPLPMLRLTIRSTIDDQPPKED